jgi:hypothetical protein
MDPGQDVSIRDSRSDFSPTQSSDGWLAAIPFNWRQSPWHFGLCSESSP